MTNGRRVGKRCGMSGATVVLAAAVAGALLFTGCRTMGPAGASEDDFHAALAAGDAEAVCTFLEEGIALDERDAFGETPLFAAARSGHADLIALLLAEGADPAATNVFGELPLHVAAAHGNRDAAALLMAVAGGGDGKDGYGRTPGEAAAEHAYLWAAGPRLVS